MTTDRVLPEQFADLEPFAPIWALRHGRDRYARRLASSMQDMQAFYDAVFPRAEEIMAYLERFPLDQLPDDALHLLWMLYSLSVVSPAVDLFKQPKVPESGDVHMEWISEPVP